MVDFSPSKLTDAEVERAERLVNEKYGHDSWTYKI